MWRLARPLSRGLRQFKRWINGVGLQFFISYSCFQIASILHCKDKIPKFRNKYSQKRNIGVSVPISTFMRLWVIYIFPWSVCLFCWRKYVDRSWDYVNRSQTHECGNWGWGRAISRKGIHKWDFRCSVPSVGYKIHTKYIILTTVRIPNSLNFLCLALCAFPDLEWWFFWFF